MTAVLVTREGAVAQVRLDRPHRRNALDAAATAELGAALTGLAEDASVRVVVLSGSGGHFCAGWDLGEMADLAAVDDTELEEMLRANHAAVANLRSLPQPVIAKAHGTTAGFGLSLLAASDLVVAAADSRFVAPEVGLGIVPALVLVDLLKVSGPRTAADWLLTAEPRTADQAHADGLVHRLAAPDGLDEAVSVLAARLAEYPPNAVAATKRLLRLGERHGDLVNPAIAEAVTSIRALLSAQASG